MTNTRRGLLVLVALFTVVAVMVADLHDAVQRVVDS